MRRSRPPCPPGEGRGTSAKEPADDTGDQWKGRKEHDVLLLIRAIGNERVAIDGDVEIPASVPPHLQVVEFVVDEAPRHPPIRKAEHEDGEIAGKQHGEARPHDDSQCIPDPRRTPPGAAPSRKIEIGRAHV